MLQKEVFLKEISFQELKVKFNCNRKLVEIGNVCIQTVKLFYRIMLISTCDNLHDVCKNFKLITNVISLDCKSGKIGL